MNAVNLIWQCEAPPERDWIRFLLSDFVVAEVNDCCFQINMEDSVVVISSRKDLPRSYIERIAHTKRCILYHISDESFHARYDDYLAFNFVFRNYWSSAFELKGIKVLPLGYVAGSEAQGSLPRATERHFVWSFMGEPKASRPEALRTLRAIEPHFVRLTGGPAGAQALGRERYACIMQDSVFCPCPMGNVHLEVFRLYEALEAGCIPIVETRLIMRYYERLFPRCPLPMVRRWSEAATLIASLLHRPEALNAKQQEIMDWWHVEKATLRAQVAGIIDECFFSGKEPEKLVRALKPIARVPGWRQLELLRHQSLASAARRAKLEFKRFVSL